jgi:hypothetical protein
MIRFQPRNTIWLAAMSILMALVLLSSNIGTEIQAFFIGLFTLVVLATFIDFSALTANTNIMDALQQASPLNRSRMSPAAREAIARASSRPGYLDPDVQVVDVGVIASQNGADGLTMRRTRTISKDDDGMRPFVTINVPPEEAERHSNLRFEVIDQNGAEQYVKEMRVFLRDGEMNILADTHLPLAGNDHIAGLGDWDLRVHVDGVLVAVHNFNLTASEDTRVRRLRGEYYVTSSDDHDDDDDDDDAPMSLEDLLRKQNGNGRG